MIHCNAVLGVLGLLGAGWKWLQAGTRGAISLSTAVAEREHRRISDREAHAKRRVPRGLCQVLLRTW